MNQSTVLVRLLTWLRSGQPPRVLPSARLLLVAAVTAPAFVVLAVAISRGMGTESEQRVARAIQRHRSPAVMYGMRFLSEAGRPPSVTAMVVVACGILIRIGRRAEAAAVATTMAGESILRMSIKLSFQRTRPESAFRVFAWGFSFPSGHAMGSLAVVGTLVTVAWPSLGRGGRMLAALMAFLFPVGVGASRVYLGVHHPSDVVGGWLAGATWLSVALGGLWPGAARRLFPGLVEESVQPVGREMLAVKGV